jgi:hypothetical protein
LVRGADSSADAEFEWLGSIICLVLLGCEVLWYLVLFFLSVLKCVMGLWNGEFKRWRLCVAEILLQIPVLALKPLLPWGHR